MDRLAGVDGWTTFRRQRSCSTNWSTPYGVGVDTKGRVYVADSKVLAIFIYQPGNRSSTK